MLLFDEADSLFAKRTEVKTSVDRYANMEVNYLLQRLDSFEGIAILTTNFGNAIDPAFKRRLTYRVTFPFPDEEMREELWRSLIPPQVPINGKIDFASLSQRFRLSGGYIRNAALRAAFLAVEEGSALTHEHLERAIRMEFREIGKLAESGNARVARACPRSRTSRDRGRARRSVQHRARNARRSRPCSAASRVPDRRCARSRPTHPR
jgi:SpoVK/Ycf46/Vps4 family AAA+-type ATPase